MPDWGRASTTLPSRDAPMCSQKATESEQVTTVPRLLLMKICSPVLEATVDKVIRSSRERRSPAWA